MTRQMAGYDRVVVIGGGLAGSETAWQAARQGVPVTLYEMRPRQTTPAHSTDRLGELVCSNSLGSDLVDRAPGLLKEELRRLGSLILACADATRVPAGGALAVGREAFSELVTQRVLALPLITLVRQEVENIPGEGLVVLATGPLTSESMTGAIGRLAGGEHLYFYDAMAPIVTLESIDMGIAFRGSRYGRGEDDYVNCPLTREEYQRFIDALLDAETIPLRSFEEEDPRFFEACLPVEVLAHRGREALAFGPMKPVGLTDPRTGRRPYAVVQLRQDNLAGTLYNLVGFQTNLRWGEQDRVFRLIPGLEGAEFMRYGQMHRNTYIDGPRVLLPTLQVRSESRILLAGQITGTEGYVGSTASGFIAGLNAGRLARGFEPIVPPPATMIGALLHYVSTPHGGGFQPMKPNFGLLPELASPPRGKRGRAGAYTERALSELTGFMELVEGVCA